MPIQGLTSQWTKRRGKVSPSKLPEIARSLGVSIKEFKKAIKEGEEQSEESGQNEVKGNSSRDDSKVDSKASSEVS